MLDLARSKLLDILYVLQPAIRRGVPVVGLEPSCLSVFRDEMINLLPENPDARKLARQAKTLSELPLETPRWHAPRLERKAVLHTHCHHKSVLDAEAERKVLESMGLELQQPSPGRCGHAGSFGYEIEHHRSRFRSQSRLCCQASGPRRPTRS